MQNHLATEWELDQLHWRITNWRRTHRPPADMPHELWERSVDVASRLGVGRTARALGLDRAALRDAVARLTTGPEFRVASAASFSELFSELGIEIGGLPEQRHAPLAEQHTQQAQHEQDELTVDLENANGAKMRIQAKGVAPEALLELVRAFGKG